VSETPVAIEGYPSQRIIIIASVLLLLVLQSVEAQIASPSQTGSRRINPRGFIPVNPPSTEETASPTARRPPPFRDNAVGPNFPRRPTPTVTPNTPSIRQIIATMSKLASAATLSATPRSIEIGQSVQFELVFPQPPPTSPDIHYGFDFDDSSETAWTSEPWTAYPYRSVGMHHASAMIRVGETLLGQNIFKADIEVHPRTNPTPTATASVPASPSPYSPSPTAILPGGFITATPRGNSINIASPTATLSPRKSGTVTPSPTLSDGRPSTKKSSPIYYIIGAGVGLVLLAYLLYPRPKPNLAMAARPTFHPHADWDAPQTPQNVAINYGLYFHSNLSAGQDSLATDGASSILRRKKQ
jgi:hypothetical protein